MDGKLEREAVHCCVLISSTELAWFEALRHTDQCNYNNSVSDSYAWSNSKPLPSGLGDHYDSFCCLCASVCLPVLHEDNIYSSSCWGSDWWPSRLTLRHLESLKKVMGSLWEPVRSWMLYSSPTSAPPSASAGDAVLSHGGNTLFRPCTRSC